MVRDLRHGRDGLQQAHHGVGVIGQRPAHHCRVACFVGVQAEAGAERYRVG